MSGLKFEWDRAKAVDNFCKHRVSFEEAQTVFDDANRRTQYDHEHSAVEDRWRVVGFSAKLRLLSVVYTRRNETTIRIISARRATQAESSRYALEV